MDILQLMLDPLQTSLKKIGKHVETECLANSLYQRFHLFSISQIICNSKDLICEHAEISQEIELEIFGRQHSENILQSL